LDSLINTGALTKFISEDYCLQRKLIRKPIINRKNWVTANVNTIKEEGQVDLNIKIGEKVFCASLNVAKDLLQDVIIGVDILKPNACILDFATNKLTWGKSKDDILTIKPLILVFLIILKFPNDFCYTSFLLYTFSPPYSPLPQKYSLYLLKL
jgi:hypothetical protein